VGNDAQDYLGRLQDLGVDTQFIGTTAGNYTAQA
jgi:adenosine kinase